MGTKYPDRPDATPFEIRKRLEWCLDVIDPSKDECYEGMPHLESLSKATHVMSIAMNHLAQATSGRRHIPLDLLTAPVADDELMRNMLADAKADVIESSPTPRRPTLKNLDDQALEEGEDGAVESDGEVATTRGARSLIDEHGLDVNLLVSQGVLVPTYCGPSGEDEPSLSKTDVRDYLGRPKNGGKDVGGTGNSGAETVSDKD